MLSVYVHCCCKLYCNNIIAPSHNVIAVEHLLITRFVSKIASKKWDMTPSDVAKKSVPAAKSFDVTDVDPSEYVPKVVPMCEVESALGREGEGEGGGLEEGGGGGGGGGRGEGGGRVGSWL